MANPDLLFKGIIRRHVRGYIADAIERLGAERVVVPCAGTFALAATARSAGVEPGSISAADISLYSSVIGSHLAGEDMRLVARGPMAWLNPYMNSSRDKAAAVVLAIRTLQYEQGRPNPFKQDNARELRAHAASHLAEAASELDTLHSILAGIHYRAEDMMALIDRHRDDPAALIVANPPRYTGGYDKMFAGIDDIFDWDAPEVPQFTEDGFIPMLADLRDAPAPMLLCYAERADQGDPASQFPGWKSVFAHRPKPGIGESVDWVLANTAAAAKLPPLLSRSDNRNPAIHRYALLGSSREIGDHSTLTVRQESAATVSYYRDLFGHRLVTSGPLARLPGGLFVDGRLLGVFVVETRAMLTSQQQTRGRIGDFQMTFSIQNDRLAHKLMLMSMASSWFWRGLIQDPLTPPPERIQTTMLTPYPEVKTARGIMALTERKETPDGYKLIYQTPVIDRTPADTIREWRRRFPSG